MKKLVLLSLALAASAAMAAEPGTYGPMNSTSINSREAVKAEALNAPQMDTGEVGEFNFNDEAGTPRDTASVRAEGAWVSRAYQTVGEV